MGDIDYKNCSLLLTVEFIIVMYEQGVSVEYLQDWLIRSMRLEEER